MNMANKEAPQQLIEALLKDKSRKYTPIKFQLSLLGLDTQLLRSLKGKAVLDVACGNGELVKHLRSQDIAAEGMDKNAPTEPYFINKNIVNMGVEGGIPRPDNTYELTLSFQNGTLNAAFAIHKIGSNTLKLLEIDTNFDAERYFQAQSTIHEMIRTTKSGSKIIIFPDLPIKEVMSLSLAGCNVTFCNEPVNPNVGRNWERWEIGTLMESFEKRTQTFSRTVIHVGKK
jgi:SAM-dependent methyltransferase